MMVVVVGVQDLGRLRRGVSMTRGLRETNGLKMTNGRRKVNLDASDGGENESLFPFPW